MTPTWTEYRMPGPAPETVIEDAAGHGPRVCDDMTVEVALAVMAGARVEYLTVCDGDDQSTGSITLVRLAGLRDSSAYTDRIRLRDVLAQSPADDRPGSGAGDCGRVPDVLTLSR